MLVSEEGLEVSGNKQPQSHVASSKEGTFLAHATCPPWFSWDAGEGAAPLQVPARCCQRWTERVSRLSGRGDTWLPAISLVKACHRAAANSGGQGGEPDILGGPSGHHMVQPVWGTCRAEGGEWRLAGNDSRTKSGWFPFSPTRWSLSATCPNPSLARSKGVNCGKRSLVRCNCSKVRTPLRCDLG